MNAHKESGPISWNMEFNSQFAILTLENRATKFKDTRLLLYKEYFFDKDIIEGIINTAIDDLIKSSFNGYLDKDKRMLELINDVFGEDIDLGNN